MTSGLGLIILVAFAAYSLFSKKISRTILTLPILFTGLGYMLSEPMNLAFKSDIIHNGKILLGQITLILVLFADASHVRFRQLKESWRIPARMLMLGLPLTIALGSVAVFFINSAAGFAMALLTAALLTPTDAALGQTVVSSPKVPRELSQTINVESGLNDGLVLPFILIGAIFASTGIGETNSDGLALHVVQELILGPVIGVAVGLFFARAMDWVQDRDYMNESAGGVCFLATAFAAYVFAVWVHGNGFIAAFVAGMVFGNTYRHDIHFISEFMEGAGQLLTMSAFFVFGAFLLPVGLAHAGWQAVVLALLFLTLVRIIPIVISLSGTNLTMKEKLFLGWFGPRGIASILFTLLMLETFELPEENELIACVSLTVGFSILLHGLSATPMANRIGREPKGKINVDP